MKTALTISYYLLAIFVGWVFSKIGQGACILTKYYINDRVIDLAKLDRSFIFDALPKIKTKTTIDLDGIYWAFSGTLHDVFPAWIISGDIGTPNTIRNIFTLRQL